MLNHALVSGILPGKLAWSSVQASERSVKYQDDPCSEHEQVNKTLEYVGAAA